MSDPTTTTTIAASVEAALSGLPPGGALVIPLAGLPAGTQVAITVVIGPPAAAEPPAPDVATPRPRYLGSRQTS